MRASTDTYEQPEFPQDVRELARRIQEETDSNTMIKLVQQLVAALDKQQLQKAHLRGQNSACATLGETDAAPASSGSVTDVK